MRQFILEKNPDKKGIVTLTGKDFKYLHQVLRIKNGDMLNASLPDGSLQNFTVANVDYKAHKIILQICADSTFSNDVSNKNITRGVSATEILQESIYTEYWLFQFIPRFQKLEQIVKQATECGIKKILLINGEYTEKSSLMALSESKKERLEKIIKEARQQSGSPVQTEFTPPLSLQEALTLWNEYISKKNLSSENVAAMVLSERNENTEFVENLVKNKKAISLAGIAVGNEGGLSPAEVENLVKNGNFLPVHFSGNILRCETAALYGIASAQILIDKNCRNDGIYGNKLKSESDNANTSDKFAEDIKNVENSETSEVIDAEDYGDEAWL